MTTVEDRAAQALDHYMALPWYTPRVMRRLAFAQACLALGRLAQALSLDPLASGEYRHQALRAAERARREADAAWPPAGRSARQNHENRDLGRNVRALREGILAWHRGRRRPRW